MKKQCRRFFVFRHRWGNSSFLHSIWCSAQGRDCTSYFCRISHHTRPNCSKNRFGKPFFQFRYSRQLLHNAGHTIFQEYCIHIHLEVFHRRGPMCSTTVGHSELFRIFFPVLLDPLGFPLNQSPQYRFWSSKKRLRIALGNVLLYNHTNWFVWEPLDIDLPRSNKTDHIGQE